MSFFEVYVSKCVNLMYICMYFIKFVGFNDATCSYYVTSGSFFVSCLFVGVISFQHVSSVRCTFFFQKILPKLSSATLQVCADMMELLRRWGDSSEDLGTELMICHVSLMLFTFLFSSEFKKNNSGNFYRSLAWGFQFWPSDFRLSLIDEHAGGWAQAFQTETTSVTSVVFLSKQS